MSNKINFIFLGRLTKEKGFDLVLEIVKKHQNSDKINFWIFGKGDKFFEDKINKIGGDQAGVKYFGWQNRKTIKNYLGKSHYCLMPSRFLETFGLSALESISEGVPVIGFSKGGLEQFILEDFDISRQDGQNDFEKLDNIIKSIIENQNKEEYETISNQLKEKSKDYSKESWLTKFQKISGKNKKIIMVSDYIENIGGIENYILESSKLLSQSGYQVDKFGLSGKLIKYKKLLMPLVGFNVFAYFGLRKKIKEFKPDIIWIHSASRYLGWLPLLNCRGKTTLMMYHDLGYFHPYPSQVYEEKQVVEFGFINFIKQANSKNPLIIFLVSLKYLSILITRKVLLKVVNCHLIPSDFMKKFLKNWGVDRDKIVVLKHFWKSGKNQNDKDNGK